MPRAKRGFKARRRRNRIFKHAQGFHLSRGRQFGDAVEQVRHAWAASYRSRKQRRRDYRQLWIARINAGARLLGVSYSKLIGKLKTTAQMIAIPMLLFDAPLQGIDLRLAGEILIYVAAALTLWSMSYYLRRAMPLLREEGKQR